MAKETRQEVEKKYDYLRRLKRAGFLWEFLRRNKEYLKLYREYLVHEDYFRKLNWHEKTKDTTFQDMKKKVLKFGLLGFIDPSKPFDKLLPRELSLVSEPIVTLGCWDDDRECLSHCDEIQPTGHRVMLVVDLNASAREIEAGIADIIKLAKKTRKVKKSKSRRRRTGGDVRIRKSEWCEYLIAYDLKPTHKVREIADILHPRHQEELPHTSDCKYCKDVRRGIKEATRLINSGYKEFLPLKKTTR